MTTLRCTTCGHSWDAIHAQEGCPKCLGVSVPHEPLSCSAPVSIWKQIDAFAAQIEAPIVAYSTDPLAMAHAVIADSQMRANMLRRLIPEAALDLKYGSE